MAIEVRDKIYFGSGRKNYLTFNRQDGSLAVYMAGVLAQKFDSSGKVTSPGGLPEAQYATDTATADLSVAVAKVTGAKRCFLNLTGTLAAGKAITLPTAAAIVGAIPGAYNGQTYLLRVANQSSGNYSWTVTTNTGLTLTEVASGSEAVAIQSLGQVILAA